MTNYIFWLGGANSSNLCTVGHEGANLPYGKRRYPTLVSDHFTHNSKALSETFTPSESRYLQQFFDKTVIAVKDSISMIYIPQKCVTNGIMIESTKTTQEFGPTGPPRFDNSAGFQYSIELRHVTAVDDNTVTPMVPAGTVLATQTIQPATAIDDAAYYYAGTSLPAWAQFVPLGTGVEVAIVFEALPTTPNVTISQLSSYIGVNASLIDNQVTQGL